MGASGAAIDPLLGPLQDNGGAAPTHELLSGSPAIDAGDNDGAHDLDQRGAERVVHVDIGAFEFDQSGAAPTFPAVPMRETYRWDHQGRLLEVQTFDTTDAVLQTVRYGYDALGRKVGREVEDATGTVTEATGYVYDGLTVLTEIDLLDSGKISSTYLLGPGVNEVVAADQADATETNTIWTFADPLGTVRSLGWYDPATGRLLMEDPIGFEAGDGNLYRYVGNHPTAAIDPSGLATVRVPSQQELAELERVEQQEWLLLQRYVKYRRLYPGSMTDSLSFYDRISTFLGGEPSSLSMNKTSLDAMSDVTPTEAELRDFIGWRKDWATVQRKAYEASLVESMLSPSMTAIRPRVPKPPPIDRPPNVTQIQPRMKTPRDPNLGPLGQRTVRSRLLDELNRSTVRERAPTGSVIRKEANVTLNRPLPGMGSGVHPNLPIRSGKKTHGIFSHDGTEVPLQSGVKGPGEHLTSNLPRLGFNARQAAQHVEGHAAAIMRKYAIRDADVYINYVGGPCRPNCQRTLHQLLPSGAKLRVHFPKPDGSIGIWEFAGGVPKHTVIQ